MVDKVHTRVASTRDIAVVTASVLAVMTACFWGTGSDDVGTGFFPGHVWVVDHLAEMLTGDHPPTSYTERIGAPEGVDLRFIGWASLIVAAPLSLLMGAIWATWIVTGLNLVVSWLVTQALLRRLIPTGATLLPAALYVLSPFALGLLANGQLAKLSLWCLPWLLLEVDKGVRDPGSPWWLVRVLMAAVLMGFTSPSIALVMPLALLLWLLARRGTIVRMVLAAGASAAGLIPALWYHSVQSGAASGLSPASAIPGLRSPPQLSPVMTWSSFIGDAPRWDISTMGVNNVSLVGPLALVLVAAAIVWRLRKSWVGILLFAGGAVFAFGPDLHLSDLDLRMPAYGLEVAGYPLTKSGMYYRFVQVAFLGLAICGSALLQTRAWSLRAGVGAIMVGCLAFNAWSTRTLWPRKTVTHASDPLYATMREDPAPGGVLEFPLSHHDTTGEIRVLAQLRHRRPTSGTAQNVVRQGNPRLERLYRKAVGSRAAEALKAEGFAYVLLHLPSKNLRLREALTSSLGTGTEAPGLVYWKL